MDEICRPVETTIGIMQGRDAIYLDSFDYDGSTLFLRGSINGNLASNTTERDVFYSISFRGVLALQILELDSWCHMDWSDNRSSSFDEITNSRWQAALGGKVTPEHRHFSFVTYDEVIDVICNDYKIQFRREI